MIKGIHHISMKCRPEQLDEVKHFYLDVLGMSICREWPEGIMFDAGGGLIEIFTNGTEDFEKGVINHFALATDDVDALAGRVREAGYEIFKGPADAVIPSEPAFPLRMAFCHGPLGEEIELFCEL